ncbi:hypothetical protein SB6411_01855 [Klebsiella spallanzanii]|uniref:Capsular polysaccharide synthesis protein n=1 Tax=Klebsiella spallanzanii TaxID=2587528 RepID=A0ABY6VF01_9ENTR|nr:capsular polysaccharide synthesis protein [Klebsiella spallanzanii]VUS60345.1 hypothetical protein SB6411_01855 [Klebsiella spallanzanii]
MQNKYHPVRGGILLYIVNFSLLLDKIFFKLFRIRTISRLTAISCLKERVIFSKLVENNSKYPLFQPKKKISSNTIWTAWFQGIESAPPLVKICIDSFGKIENHTTIIITEKNYKDYITLPELIVKKFESGIIGYTAFSEIIRIELLVTYGGIWIDSTVFIHKPFITDLFDGPFCTLKGVTVLGKGEYLGLVPAYFIGCVSRFSPMVKVRDYLFSYWENNDKQIDYFLVDYCFKLVYLQDTEFSRVVKSLPLTGLNRFKLVEMINKEYTQQNLSKIDACEYGVFKLSNKYKLREQISPDRLTFWGQLLKNKAL